MAAIVPGKTFAEFFAGIGLVREGLRQSGWECVYANDIDAKKQEIYELHFGASAHFHLGDVWETAIVVERIANRPFLATASFPCIDLSLAGHWRGLGGEHSSAFFGFTQVLRNLGRDRPKMILLENVSGFLTSRDGADFEIAVKELAELGYWIDAFAVDAKYFVPQSRPRVFVVAVDETVRRFWRKNQSQRVLEENAGEFGLSSGPLRPSRLVSLMRSIELPTGWLALDLPAPEGRCGDLGGVIDVDDAQEWWERPAVKKHYDMMSDRHREQVDKLLAGGGVHVGTIFRRKRHGKTRAEVRFDGIAGCLRTPRGGSARQIVIVVDSGALKMRWMSPREYARLQGAGDYPILGKVNQMLYGFGDAVCVPVIRWIDEHVLTPAYDSTRKHQKKGAAVGGQLNS